MRGWLLSLLLLSLSLHLMLWSSFPHPEANFSLKSLTRSKPKPSKSFCIVNHSRYTCTSFEHVQVETRLDSGPPNCLGGLESWGICDRGEFLCLSMLVHDSGPRCSIRWGFHTTEYSCTPAPFACSTHCLSEEASYGICRHNQILCKIHDVRHLPPADRIVRHSCIGSSCLLQDVFYNLQWSQRFNESLSFGCLAQWNEEMSKFECKLPGDRMDETSHAASPGSHQTSFVSDCPGIRDMRHARASNRVDVVATIDDGQSVSCAQTVNVTAYLVYFDGWNPFHQMLQSFRNIFAGWVSFSSLIESDRFDPSRSGKAGGLVPARSDCVFVTRDQEMKELGPFGRGIIPLLCRRGVLSLLNFGNSSESVCFKNIVVGVTAGGWDMEVGRREAVEVSLSGVLLSSWVKSRLGIPLQSGALEGSREGNVLFLVRHGRREIVNEYNVTSQLRGLDHINLSVHDFDRETFMEILRSVSEADIFMGVHGAGLANLVWLRPKRMVIELMVGWPRPDYFQMCASFGQYHTDYTRTSLKRPESPDWELHDARDYLVLVDDIPLLLETVVEGLNSTMSPRDVEPLPM